MQCFFSKCAKLSVAFALASTAVPGLTPAQHYNQTNLVSDPTESVGKAPVQAPGEQGAHGRLAAS